MVAELARQKKSGGKENVERKGKLSTKKKKKPY